jgi:hypothetical protein
LVVEFDALLKGPKKNSHDLGPIMSPHIYITFLLKLAKKRQERRRRRYCPCEIKKVDELHIRTKCPKQHGRLPREEDHQRVPLLEIKIHPKNVWQSFENPLAHPKCVNHM